MSSEERLRLALRRFAPLILLCTVLGAVALVAVSELQGSQYRATSQVIVENPDLNAALTENGTPSDESQTVGATAALLAASPGFFQFAARELHEPDWKTLQRQVEVSQSGSTALISFAVTAGTAARAVALAGELARAFPSYRASVEVTPVQQALAAATREAASAPRNQQLRASVARLRLLEAFTTGGLQIGNAASATKVRPVLVRSALEGATVGLVMGLLLMAALEGLDTKVRSRTEIERTLGLRTLGLTPTPRPSTGSAAASASAQGPTLDPAEDREARRLTAALDDYRAVGQGTVVAMVGATEESGLLGATAFLANALRVRKERVCVLDGGASLYEQAPPADGASNGSSNGSASPTVSTQPPAPGFSGSGRALDGGATDAEGTFAGFAGNARSADQSAAMEVLRDAGIHEELHLWLAPVMEDLRLRFDWILIDSSPALSSARASRLSGVADAVVLVANLGKLTRGELESVRREIAGWPRAPVGTILLGAQAR